MTSHDVIFTVRATDDSANKKAIFNVRNPLSDLSFLLYSDWSLNIIGLHMVAGFRNPKGHGSLEIAVHSSSDINFVCHEY